MDRRQLLTAGAAAALVGVGGKAMAKKPAPDYMPIMNDRMARGDYLGYYEERELTEPVDLIDSRGLLNPAARGWSRTPLVRANLSGHWPRKKRWNFWNWISPDFVFSVTLADIDFGLFCAFFLIDLRTQEKFEGMALKRGNAIPMPEHVERTVRFTGSGIEYANVNEGGDIKVDFSGRAANGRPVIADFTIIKPPGHETLNLVAPWSEERFQLNSKHNTLPCQGTVKVGDRTYEMDPANCHGVQDWGRGIWPYRSYWNWGVATGVQDGVTVGVNIGAKWTTGTGANENGLCIGGRLYKIMEDLDWAYDPSAWMKPWRVASRHTNVLDLTLTPLYEQNTKLSLGFVSTGGTCVFGKWNGVVRPDGNEVPVRDIIGWAEEFAHRW